MARLLGLQWATEGLFIICQNSDVLKFLSTKIQQNIILNNISILKLSAIIIAVLYNYLMSVFLIPFPISCSCSCSYCLNMRLVSNDKQILWVMLAYEHFNSYHSLFYCFLLVPGVVLDVSVFMRRAYMSGVVTPLLVIRWKPPDFTGGTITNYTVSIDWDVS